jgi:hypothetical protein
MRYATRMVVSRSAVPDHAGVYAAAEVDIDGWAPALDASLAVVPEADLFSMLSALRQFERFLREALDWRAGNWSDMAILPSASLAGSLVCKPVIPSAQGSLA